ncbi:MAG: hypothetical protein EU535_03740 [Promethearchaeota archaeon]|nr:MAG: hypothetical protein EU535_03740 [Candidatus Lokiarchaeota archaeon]
MFLEKLSDKPSPRNTKILLICSLILYIIVAPILNYYFTISNYPVSFFESQLSFSGATIKSHLRTMTSSEIDLYRTAQIIDYLYMLAYGTFWFSLSLYISRKFDAVTAWRKTGYISAIFGVIAACCDATENVFILLMLTDPRGFPDLWAISHSFFALVKFILMGLIFIWVIVAVVTLLIKKFNKG